MSRRRRLRSLATVVVLGALWSTPGCDRAGSDDLPPVDGSPPPNAHAYEAAIAEVLDVPDEPTTEAPPDPLPIVYLVLIEGALGIDAQASVIDAFASSHDVRFVDELAAAVDVDGPGRPPRDGASVLAVGAIDPSPPHRVRIEQYHTASDVDATLLTLGYVVDHWVVIAAEPVPAEALTDGG